MMKRITAVILSILLVISLFAAAAVAAGGQEKSPVLRFGTAGSGWKDFTYIYCHIYEYNGKEFFEWQTNQEKCTDSGDGIWTYDLGDKEVAFEEGKTYCVEFSCDKGGRTYPVLADKTCYEDTLICSGEFIENPTDSSKKSVIAGWKNADSAEYGPVLTITSIGSVVGTACPPTVTAQDIFKDFLLRNLDNARAYSGLSDQELIDGITQGLSLTGEQAAAAIEETGLAVDWTPSSPETEAPHTDRPATPDQPTQEPVTQEPTLPPSTGILGDVDCDGAVSVIDATLIQKYMAKLIDEKTLDLSAADVDRDGAVSIVDATRIQKYLAGLCDLEGDVTRSDNALYFDAASAGWKNSGFIGFHMSSADGEQVSGFGSPEERAEKNPDGTYRLDEEDLPIPMEEGKQYIIVFYNADGETTYELVVDRSCLGDIAKCSGEQLIDKEKALWEKADADVCGPLLAVSSTGTVIGSCIPEGRTPFIILCDFFGNTYADAVTRSGKGSQKLIDDIAQQIGIRYQYEISVAIAESGVNAVWKGADCPLPMRG